MLHPHNLLPTAALLLLLLHLPHSLSVRCFSTPAPDFTPSDFRFPSLAACMRLLQHLPDAPPPRELWQPHLFSPSLPFIPYGFFHTGDCKLSITKRPGDSWQRQGPHHHHPNNYPEWPLVQAPPIFEIYRSAKSLGAQVVAQCALEHSLWAGRADYALGGIPFRVMLEPARQMQGVPSTRWRWDARELMEGRGERPWANFWEYGDYAV